MSCHFQPPGSSMGPRYIFQLLIQEKLKNSKTATTKARKNNTDLKSLKF
jgi:hypothetical protein